MGLYFLNPNRCKANAVARVDCLEFLSDVVPRTVKSKLDRQKQLMVDKTADKDDVTEMANGNDLHSKTEPSMNSKEMKDSERDTSNADMETDNVEADEHSLDDKSQPKQD